MPPKKMLKGLIPDQNLYNRKIGFIGLESQKINYNFVEMKNLLFNKKKNSITINFEL